jgi:hypothetical protein
MRQRPARARRPELAQHAVGFVEQYDLCIHVQDQGAAIRAASDRPGGSATGNNFDNAVHRHDTLAGSLHDQRIDFRFEHGGRIQAGEIRERAYSEMIAWQLNTGCRVGGRWNGPLKRLVARGGIKPTTRGFSVARWIASGFLFQSVTGASVV